MAVTAIFRFNHDNEAHYTPGTDMLPGEIRQLPDGRACINNGMQTLKAGILARVQTCGIVEVEAPSALTLSDGDDVHIASDAIAASGGYKIGKLRRGDKISGQTTIYVALNATV